MRLKYVEERFPGYLSAEFTNGQSVEHERDDDVSVKGSPHTLAFVYERDRMLVEFIYSLAHAFDQANPEAFSKFWYEDSRK